MDATGACPDVCQGVRVGIRTIPKYIPVVGPHSVYFSALVSFRCLVLYVLFVISLASMLFRRAPRIRPSAAHPRLVISDKLIIHIPISILATLTFLLLVAGKDAPANHQSAAAGPFALIFTPRPRLTAQYAFAPLCRQ